jgi:hypothetical protein
VFFTRLLYIGHRAIPGVTRPGPCDRHPPPLIAEVASGLEQYIRLYPAHAYACYVVTSTFFPEQVFTETSFKISRIKTVLYVLSKLFRNDLRVLDADISLC